MTAFGEKLDKRGSGAGGSNNCKNIWEVAAINREQTVKPKTNNRDLQVLRFQRRSQEIVGGFRTQIKWRHQATHNNISTHPVIYQFGALGILIFWWYLKFGLLSMSLML